MKDDRKNIILLERIKADDRLAFKDLINRYKDYAFTVAYRILDNREDAEEAAQDAFLQVFKNIQTFNFESKFTTWFYRIVFNAALMQKRKNRIFTEDIDSSTQALQVSNLSDTSEDIRRVERQMAIRQAMQRLSSDDVLMISLFYLQEQSLEEIAAVVQISAETVKVKIHRARKRLAEEMRKQWKDETKSLI